MDTGVWHCHIVQIKIDGHWDIANGRRFSSWIEAKKYKDKIQSIIDELKENPDSDWNILGYEDVRMVEEGGY